MTAILVTLSVLLFAVGAARIVAWSLDRSAARIEAEYRAKRLLADAELEADIRQLELAWGREGETQR
jgi:hypothetical protein